MSQQQVADAAGTSVQQISRLEKSQRRLAENWLRLIADALGVQPADLLTDPPPDPDALSEQMEKLLVWRIWTDLPLNEKKAFIEGQLSKGANILAAHLGDKPKRRRRA